MKFLEKRKNIVITLVLICIVQLAVSILVAGQKNYLFMDELFSYASANRIGGAAIELPANEWLNEQWYLDYVSVQNEDRFDFSIPYGNQKSDVHPPLFYIFLHAACSFFPGEFSVGAGVGINIIFSLCCTVVLFLLTKEVFSSKECGLIVASLYALSFGAMNSVVFVRMYMLLILFAILYVYIHVSFFRKQNTSLLAYIAAAIVLIMGVLTQYYFIFFAFLVAVWYVCYFFKERNYQVLIRYIGTMLLSAISSIIIFPAMLDHLFRSGRGVEAQGNLFEFDGYLDNLVVFCKIIDNQLFTGTFVLILLATAAVSVLIYFLKKRIDLSFWKKTCFILFVCVGYVLIVAKLAPYQVDRYVMPIYPLVYMLTVGIVYCLMKSLFFAKVALSLCLIGFGGLSMIHTVVSGIPYTYTGNSFVQERIVTAQNNKDSCALYIDEVDNDSSRYYDVLQVLKEYKSFYFVDDLNQSSVFKRDMEHLLLEDQVVIYVNKSENDELEKVFSLIKSAFQLDSPEQISKIHVDEQWTVYAVNINQGKNN